MASAPGNTADLAPDVQEYLAHDVLRGRLVAHEPQDEAVHAHIAARVEGPHGQAVALGDPGDEGFVRGGVRAVHPPSFLCRADPAFGSFARLEGCRIAPAAFICRRARAIGSKPRRFFFGRAANRRKREEPHVTELQPAPAFGRACIERQRRARVNIHVLRTGS
jgi:hypothetical protein